MFAQKTQKARRNKMIDATAARLTFALTCVLAWLAGHAQADFGTGTITFDESSYTLYEWGNFSNTSTLTVADDQAIGLDQAFRVSTAGGDVYVRMGFDRSAANNNGGTVGSLDANDIPVVLENTSRIGYDVKARYNHEASPGGSSGLTTVEAGEEARWAYTSRYAAGHAGWTTEGDPTTYVITDAVEQGYEDQAGAYFVRSAKVAGDGLGADTGYSRTATTDGSTITDNEQWESFIIEYSGAAVTSATGEIWDIDTGGGQEVFTVSAYDSGGTLLASTTSPSPTYSESNTSSLDAKPWQWSFSDVGNIAKITFTADNGDYPLAFNNFNPVSAVGYIAPEPSSLLAFGGIFSLAMLRRRHRRVRG
jgi:hypothetical protein